MPDSSAPRVEGNAKDPAFPLYARDWLADAKVRRATPAQRGVLVDLWALAWEGDLPTDLEEIAYRVGSPRAPSPIDLVREVLQEFFDFDSVRGRWISARLEHERARRFALRAARAAAGKRGGLASGVARGSKPEANAKQTRSNEEPIAGALLNRAGAGALAPAPAPETTTTTGVEPAAAGQRDGEGSVRRTAQAEGWRDRAGGAP